MKTPQPVCIDFETESIQARPHYPPKPVGVSIMLPGKKPHYYGFGHPTGNNSTFGLAQAALRAVWDYPDGLLMHHAKFDLECAFVHFGLRTPPGLYLHDTLFLLFLDEPGLLNLSLKPNAHRLLGMAPEERDAVAEWLVEHQPILKSKATRITRKNFGAHICHAPGGIVGPYANGDVERTAALFKFLWPRVAKRKMLTAYDRERRLLPVLLDIERTGVRVDAERLTRDIAAFQAIDARLDVWLRRRIGAGEAVNLRAGQQLIAALDAAGEVDVGKLGHSAKTRKPRYDKGALKAGVADPQVAAVLLYRSQLGTCLGTFMAPWQRTAAASGGLIFTAWNQTRGEARGGARTGRLSSSPNFQNIPKEFQPIFAHEQAGLPPCPVPGVPPLPLCRSYIVPLEPGHILIGRDFQQQELRILAHFEDGNMLAQYHADVWVDFHDTVKAQLLDRLKRDFPRKQVKNTNFAIIYGAGIAKIAEMNGSTFDETKILRTGIYTLYPGLRRLYDEMRMRAAQNLPIRTWGGREYYCEKPRIIEGRLVSFDYRMVNTLIQGSAADCTKEAMVRYWETKPASHRLLLTVHDELVVSCPARELNRAQEALRAAMESVEFDLPILSEGSWSADNWGSMQNWDVKGKRNETILDGRRGAGRTAPARDHLRTGAALSAAR